MKKPYQKPWLYGEKFELVEHIAGNCGVSGRANHTGILSCGFDDGDPNGTFFLDSNKTKCAYDPFDGDISDDETLQEIVSECKYSNFSVNTSMFSS